MNRILKFIQSEVLFVIGTLLIITATLSLGYFVPSFDSDISIKQSTIDDHMMIYDDARDSYIAFRMGMVMSGVSLEHLEIIESIPVPNRPDWIERINITHDSVYQLYLNRTIESMEQLMDGKKHPNRDSLLNSPEDTILSEMKVVVEKYLDDYEFRKYFIKKQRADIAILQRNKHSTTRWSIISQVLGLFLLNLAQLIKRTQDANLKTRIEAEPAKVLFRRWPTINRNQLSRHRTKS